ncbi:MAG: AMP-binding protein [Caldimonas sp.]
MQASFDPWSTALVAADIALAAHARPVDLADRRARRTAALLEAAIHRSPLYRHLLTGSADAPRLADMPVMRKAELMRCFDRWCTEPEVRLADVRDFAADPAHVGKSFLDKYTVFESSGSSGEPGYFVQDAAAMAVYDSLELLRKPDLQPWRRLLDPWGLGEKMVFVGATGGHFASTVSIERLRRLNPLLAGGLSCLSFLQPIDVLVRELDRIAPSVIATYPSAAVLLAGEFLAGRLHKAPREIWTGGETLSPGMRKFIRDAFGCTVVNSYGTSEFLALACECKHGALHLNSDWAILEPVDADGNAVPPGTPGVTTLLTNLANHVQPLIRYDIGDQVTLRPEACPCGSPLPVLDVCGRCDETLSLLGEGGRRISIVPLALTTVLEEQAGLFDFQLVQQGAGELSLSTPERGSAATRRLHRARDVLGEFLHEQGALPVRIHCVSGRAPHRGRSGKLKRVVASAS